jgi:hypothetical protein
MSATVDKVSAVEAINMDMEYIAVLMKAVIESAEQREAVRKLNENLAEDFMVLLMKVSLIY